MRDRDVGKVGVDSLYNLIIVVPELLKLEIKVVQPGDELHLRRVAFDDYELLVEDSFDDKTAAVMLQSYAEKLFGIQRYSSLLSGDNKNPRRRIFERSFENPPLRFP